MGFSNHMKPLGTGLLDRQSDLMGSIGAPASPLRQRIEKMPVPDYLKDFEAAANAGIPEDEPSALQQRRDRYLAEEDVGFGGDTALEGGLFQGVARTGTLIKSLARVPVVIGEALSSEEEAATKGRYERFLDRTFDPLIDMGFGTPEAVNRQYAGVTWEQVKTEWGNEDVGTAEFAGTVLGFITKEGIGSVPDMVALLYAPYTYLGTRTAEIAEARKDFSGEPTRVADVAIAAGLAASIQYLDKVGLKTLGIKVDSGFENALGKAIADTSVKATAMRVGRGVGTEMATEATQEYMEFVGTTVQDNFGDIIERATDPAAAEAALIGAIAASGFGTAVATATEISGRMNARKAGPSDDEAAAASSGGTPQLPGPTQPLLLPPPPPAGAIPEEPEPPAPPPPDYSAAGEPIAPPTPTAGDYGLDDGTVTDVSTLNRDRIARMTRAGASLQNTALDKFLRQARRGEITGIPAEEQEGQAAAPAPAAPGVAVERLFDNLAKLTAMRQREFEDRLAEGKGTREQLEKLNQLVRGLAQESKETQDILNEVRRFVRNEVDAPQVSFVATAIMQRAKVMQGLGLPTKALVKSVREGDPEAVRAAVDAINREAARHIMSGEAKGGVTQPLEREDVPTELAGLTDPTARRAREYMADAEMQGRDLTKSTAPTMTAEMMYADETPNEEGRVSYRLKEGAEGSAEARERRRLIREEQNLKERIGTSGRSGAGFYTDYTREGPQYQDTPVELLDNPRPADPDDPDDLGEAPPPLVAKAQRVVRRAPDAGQTGTTGEQIDVLRDQIEDLKDERRSAKGRRKIELTKQIKAAEGEVYRLERGGDVVGTMSAQEAAGDRLRARGSSKRILRDAVIKKYGTEQKLRQLEAELMVDEERLGAAERLAQQGMVEREKAEAEERERVARNPDQPKEEKPAVRQPTGRYEGQNLYKLSEDLRKQMRELKVERRKAGENRRAEIDAKLKELDTELTRVIYEMSAMRMTDKPPAPVDKSPSGVSQLRRERARKVLEEYGRRQKKTGKGTPLATVKAFANIARQETIDAKGLPRIYVLDTAQFAQDPTNPQKALIQVEGAYPRRMVEFDANHKITKMWRPSPHKKTTLENGRKFSAPANREFFMPDEVVPVRGRPVKKFVKMPDGRVRVERDKLPQMDRTIRPDVADRVLNMVRELDLKWDGKADEFAVAQYLIDLKGPKAPKSRSERSAPVETTPRLKKLLADQEQVDDQDLEEDQEQEPDVEVFDEDEFAEMLAGALGKTVTPSDQASYYRERKERIAERERIIEAIKSERNTLMDIVRSTPIERGILAVEPHEQWPLTNHTIYAQKNDDDSVGDRYGIDTRPIRDGESVNEAMYQFIEDDIDAQLASHEIMLEQDRAELEKLNESGSAGSPGAGTKGKGGDPKVAPTAPPTGDGGAGTGDGGNVDPRVAGYEPAPKTRRAADLFVGLEPSAGSVAAFVDRARAYQLPRPDGLTLSEEQVIGIARLVRAWEVGLKGFLNLDGTGFGKSRQVVAAADMIAKAEQAKGTNRPVLIIAPGKDAEVPAKYTDEGKILGIDMKAKYPDGKPKFVVKPYNFLQGNDTTAWAAVLTDEAHKVQNLAQGATWGPKFRSMNTPFRAFFTATPTDKAGQEVWYLQYLLNEENETFAQTEARLVGQLYLRDNQKGKGGYQLRKGFKDDYLEVLDKYMRKIAAAGGAVSRTYGRLSRNFVTKVPAAQLDPKAVELYEQLRAKGMRLDDTVMEHLVERMKLPYMLEQAKEQVNGQGRKVIAMFKLQAASKHPAVIAAGLADPSVEVFTKTLRDNNMIVAAYYGESGNETDVKLFQGGRDTNQVPRDGIADVLVTTDSKGGTGVSLHDWVGLENGGRARYMMLANSFLQGNSILQAIGRHDRNDNKSIPYTEVVAIDNETDLAWRKGVAAKIEVQDVATGYRSGRKQYEELDKPQIYEDPKFLARRRTSTLLKSRLDDVVFDLARNGEDVRRVVRLIAEESDNEHMAALAGGLLRIEGGWAQLDLSAEPLNPNQPRYLGGYYAGLNRIEVLEEEGAAQTLMHEVVHHFTMENMAKNPQLVAELRALTKAALLSDPTLEVRFPNAFKNAREFVSEFFTDEDLMAELSTIYVGDGKQLSVFQRIVRWIQRLLGVTSVDQSIMERVVGLPLFRAPDGLDFDSMPLHRLAPPNVDGQRNSRLAEALDKFLAKKNPRSRAGTTGDKLFRSMLWTMTYSQIVDTFSPLFEREVDAGKPGNIAKDMEQVREKIDAAANKANDQYHEKVVAKFRKFASEFGAQKVKVRLTADGPLEEKTMLEYLAYVMNVSGYANVHFGKPPTDPRNRAILTDATARAAWRLHSKQFRKMPEAVKLYNELTNHFDSMQHERRRVLGGMFLDTLEPDAATPWVERDIKDINAKLKEMGGLSDEALKALGGTRDSLEQLEKVLEPGRVQGAYFPLRRYGDYVVVADGDQPYLTDAERDALLKKYPFAKDDKKGSRVVYQVMARFDTEAEAERYRQSLAKMIEGNDYIRVAEKVLIRAEPIRVVESSASMFSPLMNNFTRNLNKRGLDDSQTKSFQTIFAQTLLDMMPETSAAQSLRPREGIFGASLDIQRVLHNHGASQGYLMANLRYAKERADLQVEMNQHVRGLERRHPSGKRMEIVRQVLNDRELRAASQMMDLGRWPQKLSDIGFLYYLVGASYNIVNATQVPLLAGPHLAARYGAANTAKALKTAYAVAGKHPSLTLLKTGGSITQLRGIFAPPGKRKEFDRTAYDILDPMIENMDDPNHKRLLTEMRDLGDIEASMAMDMSRQAERAHVDEQGRPIPTSAWDYLTDWMRTAPHTVEVMNRSVTAIAAFELEYAKSKNYEKAKTVARDAVKQTQFVYKNWNKPPAFQHPVGRLALMFKQHVQHMYFYMIRNMAIAVHRNSDPVAKATARKALAYFVLIHVMAAGVVGGTPELAKWLLALGYWALGYDEPFEYDRMMRNLAYDLFGQPGATFASQGLPGFVGMDWSGRVGIDSMLLYDGINTQNRDSFFASVMETAGGPLAGLAGRVIDAKGKFQTGMYGRMAEDLLPKALRDPVRAYRLSDEGFKDLSGKTYMDADAYSWWDFAQQTVGFTPKTASDVYASRSLGVTRTRMMSKRERFFTRFYNADTPAERTAVMDDIRAWNRDNPDFRITRSSLIRSVQQRRRIEARTEKGVYIPRTQREWAAEEQRSY